jgi:hypothetical protein
MTESEGGLVPNAFFFNTTQRTEAEKRIPWET